MTNFFLYFPFHSIFDIFSSLLNVWYMCKVMFRLLFVPRNEIGFVVGLNGSQSVPAYFHTVQFEIWIFSFYGLLWYVQYYTFLLTIESFNFCFNKSYLTSLLCLVLRKWKWNWYWHSKCFLADFRFYPFGLVDLKLLDAINFPNGALMAI